MGHTAIAWNRRRRWRRRCAGRLPRAVCISWPCPSITGRTFAFWSRSWEGGTERLAAGPRPAHRSYFPAFAAAAEELIGAVGLEPRHADAGRHIEGFQNFCRAGVDAPQVALVTLPGAVPQLAIDPGDAGDETVGFDGAKNLAGLGVDLMDFPVAIFPDPQGALGPGQPRVTAAARRRDGRKHAAGL